MTNFKRGQSFNQSSFPEKNDTPFSYYLGAIAAALAIIFIVFYWITPKTLIKEEAPHQKLTDIFSIEPSQDFWESLHNTRIRTLEDGVNNYLELDSIQLQLKGLVENKDYKKIISLSQNLVIADSLYLNSDEFDIQLGISYYHTQQYYKSIALFERIEDHNASGSEPYILWYLGRAYLKTEQSQKAQEKLCLLQTRYELFRFESQVKQLIESYKLDCSDTEK